MLASPRSSAVIEKVFEAWVMTCFPACREVGLISLCLLY
jgi:hypothetical protein